MSCMGNGARPRVPAPTVYTLIPSVAAASAAVSGVIRPAFCWPSVRRTTNLLFAVDARSRFTAVARPEPIAVPSSIIPTLARSRFCRSQPWSSVSGHCVYGRAPNSTRPIRSSARAATNSLTTALTASSRLARPEPSVKSSDSMLPETSTASSTSTPSRWTLVAAVPACGRARATARRTSATSRSTARTIRRRAAPAGATARSPASVGKRSAAVRAEPRRHGHTRGRSAASASSHGLPSRTLDLRRRGRGLVDEPARSGPGAFTVGDGGQVARELDQVRLGHELAEKPAVRGHEPAVTRRGEQELFGGHLGRPQLEAILEVAAHDVRERRVVLLEGAVLDQTAAAQPLELGGRDLVRRAPRRRRSGALRPIERVVEDEGHEHRGEEPAAQEPVRPPVDRDRLGRLDVADVGGVGLLLEEALDGDAELVAGRVPLLRAGGTVLDGRGLEEVMPGLPADELVPPREDGLGVAPGGGIDPEVDDVAVADPVDGLRDEHLGVLRGDHLDRVAEARADGDGARLGARTDSDR